MGMGGVSGEEGRTESGLKEACFMVHSVTQSTGDPEL